MNEAIALYDISFVPTSLNSVNDIASTLKNLNNDSVDIIVISRGGEDIDVLNKAELANYCLELKPFFVTAIGHKVIVSLLEKIADKHFITPTALGQYLKDIYNNTVADFEKSKALIIENVTRTLKTSYDKEIANIIQQLKAERELKEKTITEKDSLHLKELQIVKGQIQEKEKLILQTVASAELFKNTAESLQKQLSIASAANSRAILIAVIIAVIVGLIIGIAIGS